MNPFELFKKPLTFNRHETGDLHYIGEALPAPSQITSTLSTGTPSYVGGSSVPAREDHVHALDLADLAQAIEDLMNEEDPPIEWPEPDLSAYYTSAQVDSILESYYTSSQVDGLLSLIELDILSIQSDLSILGGAISSVASDLATNYYTIDEVDLLLSLIDGGVGGPNDHTWSYTDQIVDPSVSTYSDRWYPPGDIEITELTAAVNVAGGSGNDYIIGLWVDGVMEESLILDGGTNSESSSISVAATSLNRIQVHVAKDGPFIGDAEDLSVIIRY